VILREISKNISSINTTISTEPKASFLPIRHCTAGQSVWVGKLQNENRDSLRTMKETRYRSNQEFDPSGAVPSVLSIFKKVAKMNNNEQFLKLPQVMALTALSRSSIYAYIQKKAFPAPVRISAPGGRAVAWTASSIAAWQEACINTSTATPNNGAARIRTTA
jgi:prophage regulatory protein